MKKYLFFAASALALASCSSDDFVGDNSGNLHGTTNGEIAFAGETGKITRAGSIKGEAAAKLLDNKFYVLGTKGTLSNDNPTETPVFDNYQVQWKANTAGTTSDNTNDWSYEGLDFTALNKTATTGGKQTIKYWDYSQPQYDFIAYSIGKNTLVTETSEISDGKVYGSSITTPKGTEYKSYTLKGSSITDLQKCYYTDIVTVEKENYGKPVQFTFKNITAKVRVAFYETVPGYTVSNLEFYTDNTTTKADLSGDNNKKATLFTTGDDKLTKNGTMDVIYPVVGSTNKAKAAYNKAFVNVTSQDKETLIALGEVNYGTNNVLATSAKEATMAGTSTQSYYTPVLPVAEATPLTIRMNYTLTSEDGSNETIKVYGAKAVIPAAYTAWQPNHAYTYIFKISDNTNGTTSTTTTDKEGLFPITFDAVVNNVAENDFTHESITTVSTPSVTTYAWDKTNKKVVNAYGESAVDQYPAGSDIYFSVTTTNTTNNKNKAETKSDLNNNGKLYTLSGDNADKATEAEVIDALQVRKSGGTEDLADNITGRNGLTLAKQGTSFPTTIPTEDGQNITTTANSVALLTSSNAGTYAYVYFVSDGDTKVFVTAVQGDGTTKANANEYYTDYACGTVVAENTTLEANTIYYKKYTNNNKVYGVKVVKVTTKP